MAISKRMKESIERSSWIRRMFEEGTELKAKYGDENVFDFSLGNPDLDPPREFFEKIQDLLTMDTKGIHGYMANAGFPEVRSVIAKKVKSIHGIDIEKEQIIMTCGAAGGMNAVLKTLLNPGDEVIVPKPYFTEYNFYIENHGGEIKLVDTNSDFSLNIQNIEAAITQRTKVLLINSPNNPTGRIYPEKDLKDLSSLLEKKSSKDDPIFLIADEPYREIVYDNISVPSILSLYDNSIVITSYSKNLSIPGERIGYVAVNPGSHDLNLLMNGIIISNRILGFVNAPALMQRIVGGLSDVTVDVESYKIRRDLLSQGLRDASYDFAKPEGAFYLFCKAPIEDDIAFVNHLKKYNILVVPGTGFGGPGYFRIAYCVAEDVITRAIPGFKEAMDTI